MDYFDFYVDNFVGKKSLCYSSSVYFLKIDLLDLDCI